MFDTGTWRSFNRSGPESSAKMSLARQPTVALRPNTFTTRPLESTAMHRVFRWVLCASGCEAHTNIGCRCYRQPVILPRSIYVCLSTDFRRCKVAAAKRRATAWQVAIACSQTAGVPCHIFPNTLCGCHKYASPLQHIPAMKIYRRHRRMRYSSASQKDYRLVCLVRG